MIVKEISLENFVCFIDDKNPIVFKFSKGVNIIKGRNGGGKSQLFNAFYWVLYDRIYITDIGWVESFPIKFIPDHLTKKANDGETITVSVVLKIESYFHGNLQNNAEYTFKRSIKFKKVGTDIEVLNNSELELSYLDEALQTIYIPELEIEKVLNTILPSRIRNYMWFQGETIDELINFNDTKTLKQAVQVLSYYPVYVQLHKIAELAYDGISDKISASIRANKKLSASEEGILRDIENVQKALKSNRENQEEIKKSIEKAKEQVYTKQQELSAYDKFPQIESKIKEVELEDEKLSLQSKNLENESKTKIVQSWMLVGIEELIKESAKSLEEFTKQISEKSPTNNPIPLKVPGKIYIQKMLDSKKCYICEREAPEGSDAYKAIEGRLLENEKAEEEYNEAFNKYKYLESSYIELANKPTEILSLLKEIPSEISKYRSNSRDLFQSRKTNSLRKTTLFDELGISQEEIDNVKKGAKSAKDLTEKLIFYKDAEAKFIKNLNNFKDNENGHIKNLSELLNKRKKVQASTGQKSEYEIAEPYASILIEATNILKERAYEKLVSEIEEHSNLLYSEYLAANTSSKGQIVIDRENSSVGIEENGRSISLSKGLTTAAKMSVINSILYLSTKKIGRSYPLIADAPSSVFDSENTQMYTKKIGETFEQVILMSKDYTEAELKKLALENYISNIWVLENTKIDASLSDTNRANSKTYISKLK